MYITDDDNPRLPFLRDKTSKLTTSPGVYIMKDKSGKIIYIGKAKNLKNRVSQYFHASRNHTPKVQAMVEKIDDFDIMLVDGIIGMEAAAKLRKLDESVQIIFITSLAQYAVKSYEVGALDFVLKPFSYYQLAMKLDRAIHVITRDAGLSIPVNTATGIRILSDRDITFLEVFDHDLIYHTDRETFRTRESLSKKEKELEGRPFVRVSVSHLVNLRYVSEIDGNTLKLTTGDRITISRSRKKSVMGALAKYLGGNL